MLSRSWLIVPTSLLLICAQGCANKGADQSAELYKQNADLQAENTRLRQELGQRPDPAAMAQMQQQLAARDARIADLQNQLRTPPPGQPQNNAFAGIEVTRNDREGTITVNLPGDVLFDPGKATLKSTAKTSLNKVIAAIKKDYSGKKVLVDGYTDTDPIHHTGDQWEDNLDLSAARARTVAKYLVEQGLEARQVDMRAFGDTKPKVSKSASRRVEIVVATR
jgi:flagellar motor protein MotB